MVILEGQISLLVNIEGKEVTATFIVVVSFMEGCGFMQWDNSVHLPCEGQISHRARYCYSKGKLANGQAVLGGHC